jgi:predicted XRE-type DNA-binding protein
MKNLHLSLAKVKRVKRELVRGKLTQTQIADLVGCTPPNVTHIKQGKIHADVTIDMKAVKPAKVEKPAKAAPAKKVKAAPAKKATPAKVAPKKRGRPPGSKNKPKVAAPKKTKKVKKVATKKVDLIKSWLENGMISRQAVAELLAPKEVKVAKKVEQKAEKPIKAKKETRGRPKGRWLHLSTVKRIKRLLKGGTKAPTIAKETKCSVTTVYAIRDGRIHKAA